MKTAWLVTTKYKGENMRAFASYESALKYYHKMVDKVEKQIEERVCEKVVAYSSGKPLLTQFIQWDEEYKYFTTLGSVSINQIDWEEE